MKAEIISIGTELLLGHIVNTNAVFLSRRLAEIGIDVYHHTTVGDNHARLAEAFNKAIGRSDIVITTGGLGPTVDDITIEVVKKLVDIASNAVRSNQVRNRMGTAPGLIIEYKDKIIICLPGPPREVGPMFEETIAPYLRKRCAMYGMRCTPVIKSRLVKITGLRESKVNEKVKDLLKLKPPTTVGIYAKLGEVGLKIMAKAENDKAASKEIAKIEKIINKRLGDHIFGYDNETLEGAVGKILIKKKKTLAIAESCTGGFVAHRITNVSGCSKYFMGGVTTYSNESKENLLGVSKGIIERYGSVSKQVALEMADGIKHFGCVDIGIGITGIAGPTGGTRSKPVGLVYISFVMGKKRIIKELRFNGSREEIKFQASQVALDLIRRNV